MLTETLANIHQVTMAPDHPAWLKAKGQSIQTNTVSSGPLGDHLAHHVEKLKAFSKTLLHDLATNPDECGTHHSPAGTDLRIDWADACSLGRHGERYFLLVIDKGTEYLANSNSKTRQNPVDLLRAYITTTRKAPRYLQVDGAKEFVSDEMVAFCTTVKIILQVVVAYTQCRPE
jgi:hypothetical protein